MGWGRGDGGDGMGERELGRGDRVKLKLDILRCELYGVRKKE